MASYTYTGEPDRYYPTLGLTPEPSKTYELTESPEDGRWAPVALPAKTRKEAVSA